MVSFTKVTSLWVELSLFPKVGGRELRIVQLSPTNVVSLPSMVSLQPTDPKSAKFTWNNLKFDVPRLGQYRYESYVTVRVALWAALDGGRCAILSYVESRPVMLHY